MVFWPFLTKSSAGNRPPPFSATVYYFCSRIGAFCPYGRAFRVAGRFRSIRRAIRGDPRRADEFLRRRQRLFCSLQNRTVQQLAGPVGSVLDFGCGIGRSMPYLREVFPKAEIVGCDPSAESLAIARRDNPTCRFMSMDELGSEAKFDLVIASCVFHHIPPQDRQMAIRYCYSRLKQGGHFIIFEHNPIIPVTRHLVKIVHSTPTRCC
ncbi:MAG: class I SAM-dependent methyltransferase [Pseudolabrys sp.]